MLSDNFQTIAQIEPETSFFIEIILSVLYL